MKLVCILLITILASCSTLPEVEVESNIIQLYGGSDTISFNTSDYIGQTLRLVESDKPDACITNCYPIETFPIEIVYDEYKVIINKNKYHAIKIDFETICIDKININQY